MLWRGRRGAGCGVLPDLVPWRVPQGHPALVPMGCSMGMQHPWGCWTRRGGMLWEGWMAPNKGAQLILVPEGCCCPVNLSTESIRVLQGCCCP